MLKLIFHFRDLDVSELLSVYREPDSERGGNHCFDTGADARLLDYLRYDFFAQKDACYCIWDDNGTYCSAMRLEPYMDGLLICALQTRPELHNQGFATALLSAATQAVALPIYSHIKRTNRASLSVHQKAGFRKDREGARLLDSTVSFYYDTYRR